MRCLWITPPGRDDDVSQVLCRELGIPYFLAKLLAIKGLDDPAQAETFLNPRLRDLGDPNTLPNMPRAIERIDLALRRKEKIVLYGDYDVDGVASLAVLWRILRQYGAEVSCFLPCRAEEGYGLSEAGIGKCIEEHTPGLLIAVDCGTNSTLQIASLASRGIDVIVLDHHEVQSPASDAVAIVNPKLDQDYHYLCSVGIAFKVCHALLKHAPLPNISLKDYLDLVAMGTLADLVPLVAENRSFVRAGLKQMARTRWPGVAALMEVSGVRNPVRAADVGFRLGPRINAAGRLGTAREALDLLMTDDPVEARRIAASLDLQNRERQNVERAVAEEAHRWVEKYFDPAVHTSIVLGEADWHQGVLGIVASRICRRWHRPTLVVGFDHTGAGKGSGRSIEGLCLVTALARCADYLEQFGGHEMAAGLNIRREQFEDFRTAFELAAQEMANEDILTARLRLDAELNLQEIDDHLLDAQEMLEPFGMANPQPLLFTRTVTPATEPRVMKEKHLSIEFDAGRRRLRAVYFNGAETELPRPPWDIAYRLERNVYNGRAYPQIQIVGIRSAAA